MDMSTLKASLGSAQQALSMAVLDKAMNRDAAAMATLIEDMAGSASPAALAPKAGSMDISV